VPKINPNQRELLPTIAVDSPLEAGECRDCKAPIYWVTMAGTGKKAPFDRGADIRGVLMPDGFRSVKAYKSHFASCPFAANFRKGGS
jgi:hypothetical protein